MEGLTTRKALHYLLNDPDVYNKLSPAQRSTFRVYRKRLAELENISERKMEQLLERYGYRIVQEKLWAKKK